MTKLMTSCPGCDGSRQVGECNKDCYSSMDWDDNGYHPHDVCRVCHGRYGEVPRKETLAELKGHLVKDLKDRIDLCKQISHPQGQAYLNGKIRGYEASLSAIENLFGDESCPSLEIEYPKELDIDKLGPMACKSLLRYLLTGKR